jgi:hypothetical protein
MKLIDGIKKQKEYKGEICRSYTFRILHYKIKFISFDYSNCGPPLSAQFYNNCPNNAPNNATISTMIDGILVKNMIIFFFQIVILFLSGKAQLKETVRNVKLAVE